MAISFLRPAGISPALYSVPGWLINLATVIKLILMIIWLLMKVFRLF